jgi:2-polyprenyl-3-methyl-5-hydroxy-6-metoxy-1,4-benzoquinol methylase
MNTDDRISSHYEQPDLVAAIEAGFSALGKQTSELTVDDLALVDEFHVGGRAATTSFMTGLDLRPEMTILDVGSGLGGPARFAAATHGCEVVGIDLTASYVEAARALTGWVGLDDRATFRHVSADDMAFDGRPFDAAYLMHVGMNVADKTGLFAAIAAVMKPGGTLGLYDLCRTGDAALGYPMPWAESEATSFVATTAEYESSLTAAGFEVVGAKKRPEMARVFLDGLPKPQPGGPSRPPPVGLHFVMGPTIRDKVANLVAALEAEVVTPVELVARWAAA